MSAGHLLGQRHGGLPVNIRVLRHNIGDHVIGIVLDGSAYNGEHPKQQEKSPHKHCRSHFKRPVHPVNKQHSGHRSVLIGDSLHKKAVFTHHQHIPHKAPVNKADQQSQQYDEYGRHRIVKQKLVDHI